MGHNIPAAKTLTVKRFYHCIAVIDVILFIVLFLEGMFNGFFTPMGIMPTVMAFCILYIGIGAERQARALKWTLWYHKNRKLIEDYYAKFGRIKPENAEEHG